MSRPDVGNVGHRLSFRSSINASRNAAYMTLMLRRVLLYIFGMGCVQRSCATLGTVEMGLVEMGLVEIGTVEIGTVESCEKSVCIIRNGVWSKRR